MEVKTFAKFLADILGISSALLGWFSNLDNGKSSILFITGMFYLVVRLYFYWKKQTLHVHKMKQDAEMRNLDFKEKQMEMKDREISLLERELSVRITGLSNKDRKKLMEGED